MIGFLQNPDLTVINPDFAGNYYEDGQFQAEGMTVNASFSKLLQWRLHKNPQQYEKEHENFQLEVIRDRSFLSREEDMLVWLGHASFFIRVNGVTLLTDPCLQDLPFVPRKAGLPCSIRELIGIDYLLLSHGHRDHFDEGSINMLIRQNPKMEILMPLRLGNLLGNRRKKVKYQEAGWWQQYQTNGVDIFFLPAKHWNRRGLFDFNKNLWGSFMIKTPELSGTSRRGTAAAGTPAAIYFGADSAYASHFKEIREVVGAPDICILPVGAYKPSFMMHEAHMSPEEAIQAASDLGARMMLPMHYGTYDLSDEPLREPVQLLNWLQQQGKAKSGIKLPAIGETTLLSNVVVTS